MLDHVRVMVPDVPRSRAFYEPLLEVLDYRLWHEPAAQLVGYGPKTATDEPRATIWLRGGEGESTGTLISFTVATPELVDTAYERGLRAGGRDGGEPRLRPEFHATYYSGYLIDPDGGDARAGLSSRKLNPARRCSQRLAHACLVLDEGV
jgi:catechol 2,3-dioxygenase-like lactoylglutathione lyase family enzyme